MGAHLDKLLAAAPGARAGALDRLLLSVFGHQAAGWMGSTGGLSFVKPHERMTARGLEEVRGYEERHAGGGVHNMAAMAGRVGDTAFGLPPGTPARAHLIQAHIALRGGNREEAVRHLQAAHGAAHGVNDEAGRPVQHLIAGHLQELGAPAAPSLPRPGEHLRPAVPAGAAPRRKGWFR